MDDKTKFIEIFTGLDRAYGQTQSREKNESGKLEGRSWLVKEPITIDNWNIHLEGKEPSLGIVPINDDNQCKWGAIDIDSYDGFDHQKLIKKIVEKKIPLVVCKSKSGGAHIFLFVSEPVLAKDMQIKLKEIAVWLGYGDCEIFPKQIELNSKGTGNFLNLPYNHPEFPTRYAFDDEGKALIELSSFIQHYETKVVSQLNKVVIEKPTTKKKDDDFKGAPPCLITLASDGFPEGSRNMALFQLGVYLRQRFPEELEKKIDEYNAKYFKPPLVSREVLTIYKQVEDKKYFYRCDEPMFKTVCEKIKCQSQKFGVGNAASNEIYGLKKWESDNPVYELTHNGKVIILTVDQLSSHAEYRKACIAQANESPRPMAPAIWADMVQTLLSNMQQDDFIQLPGEVTAKGQYLHQLQIFLFNNKGAKDRQDVLQGMVYELKDHLFFKPQAFRDFLKTKRFAKASDSEQYKMFEEFKGTTAKLKVNSNVEHCWKVPNTILESEYKLSKKDFSEEEAY
jgi:hypothetical protein|tara:strand:+ start:103 stop:1629 length:1527 start_codon:yes stop_codon:yes gene_type:complete